MYKNDAGHIVISGEGELYFSKAADALRYAEFMAELGWDALFYVGQIRDDGTLVRGEKEDANGLWSCVALDL